MNKRIKIGPFILALISIGLSIFVIFGRGPLQKLKTELSPSPTSLVKRKTSACLGDYPKLREMPVEDKKVLVCPVDEKYFEEALIDEENPQVLSFFLEQEEPIKAIFKGKIREIFRDQKPFPNDSAFDEIILDREDSQFYASYMIFGDVLVNEGDIIEQGQVIAKAKESSLGFRSMTNLSLWIHNKEGEFIELLKEMFK